MTLDNLGERYGLLPSEVLARGTTLDLYVYDASMSYRQYCEKKSKGEYAGSLTNDEMMAILNKARQ